MLIIVLLPWIIILLAHTFQGHTSEDGTTYNCLGPHTLVLNNENAPQVDLLADLMKAFSN